MKADHYSLSEWMNLGCCCSNTGRGRTLNAYLHTCCRLSTSIRSSLRQIPVTRSTGSGMANRYIPGVEIDLVKLDYQQTAHDCFVNVTGIFVEHLPWVSSILSLVRPSRPLPSLPSWVPNYAAKLSFGYIGHLPFLAGMRKEIDFSACMGHFLGR